LRHRIRATTWAGCILATVGLYYLSLSEAMTVNPGDGLVLACAVVWAGHLLLIGWLAPKCDALRLAAMQFAIVAVLGTTAAVVFEDPTLQAILAAKWAILYGGVFPVGITFTLQIVGQRNAPPAHAAILLSLEAVFAAAAGYLVLSETLNGREMVGCGVMLAGVLLSQTQRSPSSAPAG
ncbi:MAG: DMT family transporter, partial [Planctomycetes bacterium]|nr:DMT family transporter [Planctomycetota bacterium]